MVTAVLCYIVLDDESIVVLRAYGATINQYHTFPRKTLLSIEFRGSARKSFSDGEVSEIVWICERLEGRPGLLIANRPFAAAQLEQILSRGAFGRISLSDLVADDAVARAVGRNVSVREVRFSSSVMSRGALKAMVSAPSLRFVDLGQSSFQDEDVSGFEGGVVSDISIQSDELTDEAVTAFAKLKSLRRIIVRGTNLTDEFAVRFRKLRADVDVTVVSQ